jgi:hypothetical protein
VRAAIQALDERQPIPENALMPSSPGLPVITSNTDDADATSRVRSAAAKPAAAAKTDAPAPTEAPPPEATARAEAGAPNAGPRPFRSALIGFAAALVVVAIGAAGLRYSQRETRSVATVPTPTDPASTPSQIGTPDSPVSLPPPAAAAPPATTGSALTTSAVSSATAAAQAKPGTAAAVAPAHHATTTGAAPSIVNAPSSHQANGPPSAATPPEPSTVATVTPASASTVAPTVAPPPPPTAPPATTTAPAVAPKPAAPFDASHARASISAIEKERGVRKRDLQVALARAVAGMTQCYQAELARLGRPESGQGRIRIETDDTGRIVKANAAVAFSATVARCVERSDIGVTVAGVDTGEADANVVVAFEP